MSASNVKVAAGDPVVVAVSEIGEERWGFHQFPALMRFPDGTIVLMYADAADASETHGEPAPAFASSDDGRTWMPFRGDPQPIRPHFSMSEVFNGEYLVMPSQRYLDISGTDIVMPEPRSEATVYGTVRSYHTSEMPIEVQEYFHNIPAKRWTPSTGKWSDDTVEYDMTNHLTWKRSDSTVLPRTFFEHSLLKHDNELLYADSRVRYAMPDGTIAPKGASHLMVSTDNGHSFKRRSVISADPSGSDIMAEPHLCRTADGDLVCAVRKTDQDQKPMVLTWSDDDGHTWTKPKEVFEFGVWPCLQLMGNRILVLSYGRPGVHMRFAADGRGLEWSDAVTLIEGDHAEYVKHSCGYTSILALLDDTFLIAYSDFLHVDSGGNRRKAILVKEVKVSD